MVRFPIVAVRSKGNPGITVLECCIIGSLIVAIDFEQFGDPAIGVVLLQVHQQSDGQLSRQDVPDYSHQISVFGIVSEQHEIV